MTKEQILNGMSEEEFYSLYPTRESWEAAQTQMAYGGVAEIMGIPFGAGVILADGGTPYYGGPIYPAQAGVATPVPAMDPDMYEQNVLAPKDQAYTQNLINRAKKQQEWNKAHPWSSTGKTTSEGYGLFTKTGQSGTPQEYMFKEGQYTPYTPPMPIAGNNLIKKYGGLPMAQNGTILDWAKKEQQALQQRTGMTTPTEAKKYYGSFDIPSVEQMDSVHVSPVNPNIGMGFKGSKSMLIPLSKSATQEVSKINKPYTTATPPKRGEREVFVQYQQTGGSMTPDLQGQYPIFNYGGYDSVFNYGQFPAMSHGGSKSKDVTSQGGNQSFLDERNNNYLNYIKNNVLKNIQQEEAEKVQNAFMQMENQYMQMGGNSFDRINPQNAALQNMYGQQMQQYRNQAAQDQANFREANMNLLGSIYGMPMAQEGKSTGSSASDILHQFAEEFGPRSRRTGLPLFPANIGTYYQMNKKDAASLAGLPQGFQMQGVKMTPQWGLGARTAMNIGNMFRGKSSKKVVPGFAPKAITFEFSGKVPPRGIFEDLKEPLKFDPQQPMLGPEIKQDTVSPYGPIPAGTTQAPVPYMPASIKPGGYNASGKMINEKYPGLTPSYIPASMQFNTMAYGGDYFGQFYDGGIPMYQGSLTGSQTSNPVSNDQWKNSLKFTPPVVDDREEMPPMQTVGAKEQTEQEALADVAGIQKRRQEQRDMFGAPMGDQPDLLTPEKDVNAKATLKRKRSGIGQAIGQYAVPAINKISSILEQKDYNKAKKKLEESMLADNTFMTSPLNAKNRGDYDPNSGMFRPDQMVPVQFPGYAQWGGFNTMAMGGSYEEGEELDLSPEEIEELRQQGYEIEYLD